VRSAARELGVDPVTVSGTGAGGRVTLADVRGAVPARATSAADERVPMPKIRARAASALLAAKQTAAHALCVVDVDYSAIEAARLPERERWRAREGFALTYLPFVARAVVGALAEHPFLNARVEGDTATTSHAVHLGVAIDLEYQGLIVAVVRDAETRSLRGLARAIRDLSTRARAGRLTPDDVGSATFTITNPGAHGTWISVPVIPLPQVAIISTDGVAPRVVEQVLSDGSAHLAIRPRGHLCLSYDARAVAPADAAAFALELQRRMERTDWSSEL
jgi:2-oxoglutarate dehydrogenase E2 component (dihydrolipoamide succinyltransferase)